MSEKEKMINGELYEPYCEELEQDRLRAKSLCMEYNTLTPDKKEEKQQILKSLLGKYGNNTVIEPNFFCDYGYNIEFDGFVYINHNSVFLDCAKIKIGSDTFIGPNCGFYTACHPINAEERIKGKEQAKPITIGSAVWLGGGVTILGGVNIGDRAVIGAGSVVTHNIPPDSVAAGNPCRIIRKINQ
ncbi:MAG: sugar O-acetyltransferase [Candidatus Gastranaerophilales bacterium]|nr:sugar O-acetyltransferase [Candidatus Gastranaerophilales bacterium]